MQERRFSHDEVISELKNEIQMRKRVYEKRVAQKKMSNAQMQRKIDLIDAAITFVEYLKSNLKYERELFKAREMRRNIQESDLPSRAEIADDIFSEIVATTDRKLEREEVDALVEFTEKLLRTMFAAGWMKCYEYFLRERGK